MSSNEMAEKQWQVGRYNLSDSKPYLRQYFVTTVGVCTQSSGSEDLMNNQSQKDAYRSKDAHFDSQTQRPLHSVQSTLPPPSQTELR